MHERNGAEEKAGAPVPFGLVLEAVLVLAADRPCLLLEEVEEKGQGGDHPRGTLLLRLNFLDLPLHPGTMDALLNEPAFEIGTRLEGAGARIQIARAFGDPLKTLGLPLGVVFPGDHDLLFDPRRFRRPLLTHRVPSWD